MMNTQEFSPVEARAIVRRHVHDLRNVLNSVDLEVACMREEPAGAAFPTEFQNISKQIAGTERILRSLSIRFSEPDCHLAAAADIFQSWQQQVSRIEYAKVVRFDPPASTASIRVDFAAIAGVLAEISFEACSLCKDTVFAASLTGYSGSVIFALKAPCPESVFEETPPGTQQWAEWQHLVTRSGGRLQREWDGAKGQMVISIAVPTLD